MKRFIFVECDELSDKGYNKAVKVYLLVSGGYPKFVGSNYKLSSASWYGYSAEAVQIVGKELGHKHNNYKFNSKNIEIRSI